MKIKLSEREKWLLLAAGLLFVAFVFFQYLYLPKSAENYALREKLKNKRLELKTSLEKARILEKLELEPVENLARRVTKDQQVMVALHHISREVAKLKLNLQSIRPRLEEIPVDSAKSVFFDLSFTGKYNDIYKFMAALEKLPILILVDSLEMNGTGSSELRVNMVLSIYY